MKRELNSRSRRKWVAGGVLVFGSIALLSTGFATWVVGVQKTYDAGEISVSVDTLSSDMYRVTYTPTDSTMKISETADVAVGDVVSATHDGDWVISGTLTVLTKTNSAPAGTVTATLPESYTVYGESTSTTVNQANLVTLAAVGTGNNATGLHGAAGDTKHYVNPTGAVSNINWTAGAQSGSFYTFTSPITVTFSWGDYYGADGLAAFYNNNFAPTTITGDDFDHIQAEYDAMNTAMTGSNILTVVIDAPAS